MRCWEVRLTEEVKMKRGSSDGSERRSLRRAPWTRVAEIAGVGGQVPSV